MIFQPKLAHLILEGRKTMTRRPVRGDENASHYAIGKTYALERPRRLDELSDLDQERVKRHKVSLQRFRETVGRILITDVRRELLGELTLDDAIAEGFKTRAAFADYWMRLHDPGWPTMDLGECPHCDEEHVVERWCSRCEGSGVLHAPEVLTGPAAVDRPCPVCDASGRVWVECPHCDMGVATVEAEATDAEILQRFEARHADRFVWVLSFDVVRAHMDQPRLLSAGSPHTPGKARLLSGKKKRPGHASPPGGALTPDVAAGYTTNPSRALLSAGEAVDPATQARISERAGMETAQWLALDHAQREAMDIGARLAAVRAHAELVGVDVTRIEKSIVSRVRVMEHKVSRLAAQKLPVDDLERLAS